MLVACGGASTGARAPVAPLDLRDAVPSGASVVVIARPVELAASPVAMEVVRALVPDERWERFRAATGVDPRELELLVWADYEDGSVLAIRGPFLSRVVALEMANQMRVVDSSSDDPVVRRGGLYHGVRRDVIAIGEHEILLVSGSPALTGRALDTLEGGARRLDASATVADLMSSHADAPLVLLAPEPLGLDPSTGVGLLLSEEEALAATAVPGADGLIRLRVDVRGGLPPGADENFRALVRSVAASDLGSVIGMADVVGSLEVETTEERAVLTASIAPGAVARGLRALLVAEIEEVVGPVTGGP